MTSEGTVGTASHHLRRWVRERIMACLWPTMLAVPRCCGKRSLPATLVSLGEMGVGGGGGFTRRVQLWEGGDEQGWK